MIPNHSRFWKFSFAWSFAWRDLCEREARGTGLVIIATIALITLGGIVSVTLPFATERVRLERLRANPMARCIWVRDRSSGRRFEEDDLRKFDDHLHKSLPRPEHLSGCHPFTQISLQWHFAKGGSDKFRGRTLAPDDPLFRSASEKKLLSSGDPFVGKDQPGVIITPGLLKNLGYPDDTKAGAMLKFNSPTSGAEIKIEIIGITHDPLPVTDFFFIINDNEYARLLNMDPDQSSDAIETGGLGHGWPESPMDLGPKIQNMFGVWQWRGFARTRDGGKPCYRFQLAVEGAMPKSRWKDHLDELHDAIVRDGLPQHDKFVVVHMREAEFKDPPPPRTPPGWVGVYVEELEDLEALDAILKEDDWLTNGPAIAQLKEIRRSTVMTVIVLYVLIGLSCLAALMSFYALNELRAKQKAAQIGMMRAMGTSNGLLSVILLIEAFLLWVGGTLVGILAFGFLTPLALCLLESAELWMIVLDWKCLTSFTVFLCSSLIATMCIAWCSTKKMRARSPNQLLALTS